jgi:hypothetical protein
MGAAVIILLIIAGVAVASPGSVSAKPKDLPSVFPAGAKVVKDRWWGPFRIVVYEHRGDFGWIVEQTKAALDETGEAVEAKLESGFENANLAEASAIVFAQTQVDVDMIEGMRVVGLAEHERDDGLYRSWKAQKGQDESVLVVYFIPAESALGAWKVYDRKGWPGTVKARGEASSDGEMWEAVAGVL